MSDQNTNAKAAPTSHSPRGLLLAQQLEICEKIGANAWVALRVPFGDEVITETEFEATLRDARSVLKAKAIKADSFAVYLSNFRRCVKAGIAIPPTRKEYSAIADKLPKGAKGAKAKPAADNGAAEADAALGEAFQRLLEGMGVSAAELVEIAKTAQAVGPRVLAAAAAAVKRAGEDRVVAVLTATTGRSSKLADIDEAEEAELVGAAEPMVLEDMRQAS